MPHSATSKPASRPRVLIVDDERRNRQLLEVMLGAEGYELDFAESADDALAKVAAQPPALVLLDIMMPGSSGYQVAAEIKRDPATKGIYVVMVSALDDRNSKNHAKNVGADAFLTKPVNRAELCEVVARFLQPAPEPGA